MYRFLIDTYLSSIDIQDLKYKNIRQTNLNAFFIVVLDPQLILWILRIGVFL